MVHQGGGVGEEEVQVLDRLAEEEALHGVLQAVHAGGTCRRYKQAVQHAFYGMPAALFCAAAGEAASCRFQAQAAGQA